MRTLISGLLALFTLAGHGRAEDDHADPTRVFLVVDQPAKIKGKFTAAPLKQDMFEALTKQRPIVERPAFGGMTPLKGTTAATMQADAIKANAGLILHVTMLESAKEGKKTALNAQYTIYEPKKDADPDKPMTFWQKGPVEKLKTVAPEIDPDSLLGKTLGGRVPHDANHLMVVELMAAVVKKMAVTKGIEGKVAEKGTLTITVTVENKSKVAILGLTLAVPHEDYVKYIPGKADIAAGETKKVTYTVKDADAARIVVKNAKLAEIYPEREKKK